MFFDLLRSLLVREATVGGLLARSDCGVFQCHGRKPSILQFLGHSLWPVVRLRLGIVAVTLLGGTALGSPSGDDIASGRILNQSHVRRRANGHAALHELNELVSLLVCGLCVLATK